MKKWTKVFIWLLVVVSVFAVGACNKDTPQERPEPDVPSFAQTDEMLCKDGASGYSIVIPAAANRNSVESFAAEELQNIFYNTTGVTLPVVADTDVTFSADNRHISVGDTSVFAGCGYDMQPLDLNFDGYIVKRYGKTVVINAKSQAGKINGVYGFCEKNLGYMYYASDCVRYGKSQNVRLVDFDWVDVPDFQGRISYSAEMIYNPLNRLRLRNNNQLTGHVAKYGEGDLWCLSDQSVCFEILPFWKYYTAHPDWYYMDSAVTDKGNGVLEYVYNDITYTIDLKDLSKTPFDSSGMPFSQSGLWLLIKNHVQICYTKALSDAEMFGEFTKNLKEHIVNNPTRRLFMLGMSDNNNVCTCSACTESNKRYTVSGTTMRFVNAVADDVESWRVQNYPDREVQLVVFAYLSTQEAPVKDVLENGKYVPVDASVVARDNVTVRIAPINSCHYYTFDNVGKNALSAKMFASWRECAKSFAIWDYKVSFSTQIVPFPTWNSTAYNYRMYKEMGVMDILSQGDTRSYNICMSKMDDYVRSRLLWDVSLNYQDLCYEFIENYFGVAAPQMRAYYDYMQLHFATKIATNNNFHAYTYSGLSERGYWPMETLLTMRAIFEDAYARINALPAEEQTAVRDRVDTESAFYRFALLELYDAEAFSTAQLEEEIDAFAAIRNVCTFPTDGITAAEYVTRWRNKI